MSATTTIEIDADASGTRGTRGRFLRHFAEMLVAMFMGMVALGGLTEVVFAAAGSSLTDAHGSVQVLLMGINMTVPMVAWMSHRGHPRAHNSEMAASMIVPSVAAAALAAAGLVSAAGALGVQHAVMIPAMLGVMLWRYDHYAQPHAHAA
jgi:hypothetical protein